MKLLRLYPLEALRTFRGVTQKPGMSDGNIELRIRFSFNTACSPRGAVANMRVRKYSHWTKEQQLGVLHFMDMMVILVR